LNPARLPIPPSGLT